MKFLHYVFFLLALVTTFGAIVGAEEDPIDKPFEATLFALFAAVVGAYLSQWVGR